VSWHYSNIVNQRTAAGGTTNLVTVPAGDRWVIRSWRLTSAVGVTQTEVELVLRNPSGPTDADLCEQVLGSGQSVGEADCRHVLESNWSIVVYHAGTGPLSICISGVKYSPAPT
jgi:hypothetical protein